MTVTCLPASSEVCGERAGDCPLYHDGGPATVYESQQGKSMGTNWVDWFRNEAISNYIVFAAGVIVGIIGWLVAKRLTRKKPSLIQVEKKFQSELVNIDPEVKDRLRITYDGHPITELHQAIFTINNAGEEPIKDIDITFYFEGLEGQNFLEAVLTNEEEIQRIEVKPLGPDFDSLTIHLPFLNPRKEYEDYLGVTLYAPKPLSIKTVTGKGCGWSTKYIDKTEYIDRLLNVLAEGASPVGYLTAKLVDILVRF